MFRRKEAKEGMTDKGNSPGSAPRTPASWTGEDTLKKRCRRSEIGIRTAYERAVYLREAEGFLPFVVVADKEDAEITFDIHDRRPVTELMGESLEDRLIALEGAGWLKNNEDLYEFSMDPENLYYDIHGTVYVLMRYLRQEPPAYSFVEKYRSLIGAVLQDRYSYRDYLEGGQGLLEKDPFLATIRGMTRTKDIQEALRNEYLRVHEEAQALYVLQPKGKVRKLRRTAAASTVIYLPWPWRMPTSRATTRAASGRWKRCPSGGWTRRRGTCSRLPTCGSNPLTRNRRRTSLRRFL